MNTLDLTLQRKTDSGYPVAASLTRPGGFLPLRREGMLNLDIPALAELQYDSLAYGIALGQALFVDEIRDTFREGLSGGEPLRVLLSIEAPDLRALDWHRLAAPFDGRWRFLASQQNTPFSLSIPSPASAHFPAIGRRDLRALLLVAGPESLSGDYKLASFDVPATIASIQAALGDIPCDVLPNPTLDALCVTLTATPYTILHIVCHGAVKENGETILFFPKDSKGTHTPATDLLNRLGSLARLPHFAFIAACESALPQNGLGSLAGRLVRELGLPAVLAMTDRVSIATASAIAAPFYAHLYQHGQPDVALAQSLAGLQGAHDLTVPAIFSRLGDRPLFDDNSARALTEKELEFGLVRLAESLSERAPVLTAHLDALTRRLRSTLGADSKSLSESTRTERKETLDQLNSLSLEALDLSFNALCLGQTPPAYDSRSPFRGLESFRPEDAAYFFGREALTRKLAQKLNEHNFLAVLGASGSGKSSLVMAGLIPAFNVPSAVFRPGAEPLAELEKALQAEPQLLVVDQFEELFTLSAREQRAEFISRLLEQSHRLRVVITLRADFLGEVAPFKSLKDEVQNHQEIIPPMDETELRRAMEGQAACAGLRFESDLSQQMLDDVSGEPGAMPLLQHTLWTLWTRRHGRWLRAEEYRAFGGVKQAIASTAEAVYARCSEFERERLRDIFLRLTRLDEGTDGRDTRRRVLLRDLIPADSDPAATTLLIKQLADARLVVVTGGEVEVAHEALIRHWERLRIWLNDDRDNLRVREGVTDDANQWNEAGRDESLLSHRGARLELALAMSKNPRYRLNPTEQAYLDGCVAVREREKASAAKRKQYAIAGVSVAILVIMVILAGWGWTSNQNSIALEYQVATAEYSQQQERAQASTAVAAQSTAIAESNLRATAQANTEAQAEIVKARELAARAQILLADNPHTSLLLAIESLRRYHTFEADAVLRQLVSEFPRVLFTFDGRCLAYSPDSNLLVCQAKDGSLVIWDIPTRQIVQTVQIASGVFDVDINRDNRFLRVTNIQGQQTIWNIKEGLMVSSAEPGESIGVSPTGETLAWLDSNRQLSLRKVDKSFIADLSPADLYEFSPQGDFLLSVDETLLSIWDGATGKAIAQLEFPDAIKVAFFADDGKGILAADAAGNVQMWNFSTGQVVMQKKMEEEIRSLAYSDSGEFYAALTDARQLQVWSAAGDSIPVTGVSSPIQEIAFAAGTNTLLVQDDSFIRAYYFPGAALVEEFYNPQSGIMFASPDGSKIANVYAGEISPEISGVVIQNLVGRNLYKVMRTGRVRFFSPDSQTFVFQNEDSGPTQVLGFSKSLEWRGETNVTQNGGQILGEEAVNCQVNTKTVSIRYGDGRIFSMDYPDNFSDDCPVVFLARNQEWLAIGWSETVTIFEIGNEEVRSLPFSKGGQPAIASVKDMYLNADQTRLIAGGGDFAIIWDVKSWQPIQTLSLGDNLGFFGLTVERMALNRDGSKAVITEYSGPNVAFENLAIYDVATGAKLSGTAAARYDVFQALFSGPNDEFITTIPVTEASLNYLWQPQDLIAQACQHALRNLSRQEWNRYLGDLPYQAVCPNLPIEPAPTATPTP